MPPIPTFGDYQYFFFLQKDTPNAFEEAEAQCKNGDGRHLVSIHDKTIDGQTESEFVLKLAKDNGFNGTLWIGLWCDETAENMSKFSHSPGHLLFPHYT